MPSRNKDPRDECSNSTQPRYGQMSIIGCNEFEGCGERSSSVLG